MREVFVHIVGKPASGKTTAAALIAMALRQIGCEVTVEVLKPGRPIGEADFSKIDLSASQPMRVTIREHSIDNVSNGSET